MTGRDKGRVVVIGGAGYVGSVLVRHLVQSGYAVDILDAFRFGREPVADFEGGPGVRVVEADIRCIHNVTPYLEGAHGVVLLAALVGEAACDRDPRETIETNLLATRSVAHAARLCGVERFLFASTDSVYGVQEGVMTETSPLNPISLYARLKAEAEMEILGLGRDGFRPTVLRISTVYGLSPRMRFDLIINIFAMHAATRGKVTIYGGKQWRPLVHVADAARAYQLCLEAPLEIVGGRVFNVGSDEQNVQIGQLGELVTRVFPHVKLGKVPQPPDLRDYFVSCTRIREELGYHVERTPEDGLREIGQAVANGAFPDPEDKRYRNA